MEQYPSQLAGGTKARLLAAVDHGCKENDSKWVRLQWTRPDAPRFSCGDLNAVLRFKEQNMLDSGIMDAYLHLLSERSDGVACLPCSFVREMVTDRDAFLARTIGRYLNANLFEAYHTFIVPLHVNDHWTVGLIRKAPAAGCFPEITVYDSLRKQHVTASVATSRGASREVDVRDLLRDAAHCLCVDPVAEEIPAELGTCGGLLQTHADAYRLDATLVKYVSMGVQKNSNNCGFFACEIAKRAALPALRASIDTPPPRENDMERYKMRLVYELLTGELLVR